MPLTPGTSSATKSQNIVEMMDAGHPQDQAVAAAMRMARQTRKRRAEGGHIDPPTVEKPVTTHHSGPIMSSVAGRTDHLPMHVDDGSYVLPADIVSGLGEGNTMAGFKVAKALPKLFAETFYGKKRAGAGMPMDATETPYGAEGTPYTNEAMPYGVPEPHADGGKARGVPIVAAGGEHVYPPSDVKMFGNGDLARGHAILDAWVPHYRAQLVKTLKNLPGPKRD
jgi:hypothetical protein